MAARPGIGTVTSGTSLFSVGDLSFVCNSRQVDFISEILSCYPHLYFTSFSNIPDADCEK